MNSAEQLVEALLDGNTPVSALLEAETDDLSGYKEIYGPSRSLLEKYMELGVLELDGAVRRYGSHYVHERSTEADIDYSLYMDDDALSSMTDVAKQELDSDINELVGRLDRELNERMVDWNHKIYRELESAYEYSRSDEVVAETIIANEYTFDEDGNRDDDENILYHQLNDEAKQRAREWWVNGEDESGDTYYAEPVIAEWKWLLDQKGFKEVEINWSGFWSQGDGASFTAKSIDFKKYFSFPDPLEFPETERQQLTESDAEDAKEVSLPIPTESAAQHLLELFQANPIFSELKIYKPLGLEAVASAVKGRVNADAWDASSAVDEVLAQTDTGAQIHYKKVIIFGAPMDVYPRQFIVILRPDPRTIKESDDDYAMKEMGVPAEDMDIYIRWTYDEPQEKTGDKPVWEEAGPFSSLEKAQEHILGTLSPRRHEIKQMYLFTINTHPAVGALARQKTSHVYRVNPSTGTLRQAAKPMQVENEQAKA